MSDYIYHIGDDYDCINKDFLAAHVQLPCNPIIINLSLDTESPL